MCRNSAKAYDDSRFYELHLLTQILDTDILLFGFRVTIHGWTALDDIGNIYVFISVKVDE